MSLYEERKGNVIQENFQAGRKKIYLRNKDKPDGVNSNNVLNALDYLKNKQDHYFGIELKLVSMLPEKERAQYIQKRIDDLKKVQNELK